MAGVPLTAAELRIIRRHTHALLAGRHAQVMDATLASIRDIARLKRRPGDPRPALRSRATIYQRIAKAVAGRRQGAYCSVWTDRERAIAARHLAALMDGRVRVVADAATDCLRDLRRLYRRLPEGRRAAQTRTWKGVYGVLLREARRLGWTRVGGEDWNEKERAILNRYVDALVRGRYRSGYAAAGDCLAELARVRSRRRRRAHRVVNSLKGVFRRLVAEAEKRGWKRDVRYWLPEESRILERHARMLVRRSAPDVEEVARRCCAALDRLYDRLRASNPDILASVTRRTYWTIRTYLDRRALELGRPIFEGWEDDELGIVNRHARRLIAREHKDAPTAARAARRELAGLRKQWRSTDPERFRRARPRSFDSVYRQTCASAHALGPRWPKTGWTPKELEIVHRWIGWYERNRRVRRLHPAKTAVEGIHEELGRIDSLRTIGGVRAQFWKELRKKHGIRS